MMAEIAGLTRYEQKLRRALSSRLQKTFGSEWPSAAVPSKMLERWEGFAKQRGLASATCALIDFSSLGDLFSLIERHWSSVGDLVGGDREEFRVFSRRLKMVRDDEGHSRPVGEAAKGLAEAVCSQLATVLQSATGPATQESLDSAYENFAQPDLGYAASRDLLQQLWEDRDRLELSPGHLAFLVQSEDLSAEGTVTRWLDAYGVDVLVLLRLLTDHSVRLTWVVQGKRSGVPVTGLGAALRWTLEHEGPTVTLRMVSEAIHMLPTAITNEEGKAVSKEGANLLASLALERAISQLTHDAYIGCCERYCKRVSGYEDPPDEEGRRLIFVNEKQPCHVAEDIPEATPIVSLTCRLEAVSELRQGSSVSPDALMEWLRQSLGVVSLVFAAHRRSSDGQSRRVGDGVWIDEPEIAGDGKSLGDIS